MSTELPPPPAAAVETFGPALPLAERYARWLAEAGVARGLLGPREVPRLWERHLLNSAAVAPVVPRDAVAVDVGSGAGLPGIPVVLVRPDVRMTLVEPLLRRTTFLEEVVADLDLDVHVQRCRGEDVPPQSVDVVLARAVAPLDRLAAVTLGALRPGGVLVALKGRSVREELVAAEPTLRRLGARAWRVEELGHADEPTRAVVVVAGERRRRR